MNGTTLLAAGDSPRTYDSVHFHCCLIFDLFRLSFSASPPTRPSPPLPLGGRWWPQTAKQQGDKISKKFLCKIGKKRIERPNVGGVSIRSRNGAPSRKGCVVNGQTTKSSNKGVRPSRSSRLAVCHTGNHMSLFFYAGGYHIGNSFPPRPVSKTPGFPTCGSDGVSDVHGSKVHLSPGGDQVSGRFLASDASYFVLFLRFAIGVEIGISLIGFVLIRVDESDLLLCHSVKVMLCMSLDGTK